MSAFFCKKSPVFDKNSAITQSNSVKLCVRDYMSGILFRDCSKFAINWKTKNDATTSRHDVTVKFFWRCIFSFMNFSYWSKFHINISIGSGVMTIFFHRGLTRNPEIGIPPSEFCSISGDWGKLGIPNLGRTSLIKCC